MSTNVLLACGALLAGGVAYNAVVGREIAQGRGDFQARFVALGVGGTVLTVGAATGNWEMVGITLLAFACSGTGMAIGSWRRRQH